MNYIGLLLIVCWLFCPPLSVAAQVSVHFKDHAEVSDQKIVLADIADIQPVGPTTEALGQLPIAAAPAPGRTKELYVVTVINGLRNRPEAADVDWQGSQTVVVERKAVTLTPEQMQAMVAAYLKENSSILPKAEIRFTSVRTPEAMTLPAGTLTWKVTPSRPGIVGSTNFVIALFVDGNPAGNCTLRGRLEAIAEVLTAASALHRGDLVTEDNVVLQRQDVSSVENPLFVKEEILGKQIARTVAPGTILKPEHIVLPPVIKEGEMVKIIARKGSLQLSTSGLARADGRLGETIAVKNISSNKVIHCRVEGPGVVSVEF
ncbi:MAG: flagellar basal body P-ring formation chaperone FlgA [Desulfobulbus sp.]|uniref:flagellar basal body P-ring formation chaperone FlgA n=1 Tax=Desulfobulbus sp. TaxID=895 RepID=UPI00284A3541|nr:flagellar basal body P-ring formation chaperone FlgA [Desulfobulbus sp.]MDR2550748.1 flagellar basal body P-ring formation chaperone FlgA [Desulfobulbus sp.]